MCSSRAFFLFVSEAGRGPRYAHDRETSESAYEILTKVQAPPGTRRRRIPWFAWATEARPATAVLPRLSISFDLDRLTGGGAYLSDCSGEHEPCARIGWMSDGEPAARTVGKPARTPRSACAFSAWIPRGSRRATAPSSGRNRSARVSRTTLCGWDLKLYQRAPAWRRVGLRQGDRGGRDTWRPGVWVCSIRSWGGNE